MSGTDSAKLDDVDGPEREDQIFACRPGQSHDRRPELYGLLIEELEAVET